MLHRDWRFWVGALISVAGLAVLLENFPDRTTATAIGSAMFFSGIIVMVMNDSDGEEG
ncbi:MAG: hypothetical protein KGI71_06155 [Patescibacteria group bacterium]|nr:hypothetical protein [Patescibacteria group bacterium]